MRICLLTDQELDTEPFDEEDWPCDPRPFIPDAEWTLATMEKESAVSEILLLARQGFDCFFNLCDGAWDEGRVGIELVQTLEMLDVPFTGATSEFFEPSREAMKRVCSAWGLNAPDYVYALGSEDIERAASELRFPMFVKHPSSYASNGLTRDSKVDDADALRTQCTSMIEQFGSVLIEEYIDGPEATVLVAENPQDPRNPITYTPLVYQFPEGETFKHYDLKWVNYDGLQSRPIDDPQLDTLLRQVSADFFVGMRGAGFGRCDIRIDADGVPYLLEINPNCGVFYPPTDPGSADLCLLAEEDGHARFAQQLVDAALARHARRRKAWEVRSRGGGDYGIYTTRAVKTGETLMRYEQSDHVIVSRGHVEQNWSEREQDWFRRYAWPLSDDIFVTWHQDPEHWKPTGHSCEPSAWLDGLDVVARTPLPAGAEITLDYGTFYNEQMPDFECSCGQHNCRGVIRGTDYLQPFIKRYGKHVSNYVLRARRENSAPAPALRVVADE